MGPPIRHDTESEYHPEGVDAAASRSNLHDVLQTPEDLNSNDDDGLFPSVDDGSEPVVFTEEQIHARFSRCKSHRNQLLRAVSQSVNFPGKTVQYSPAQVDPIML